MIENEHWNWSQETLKSIIKDIIDRKKSWEKRADSEFEEGIAVGYGFVLDSIKNQLEARGYDFEDWLK